MKMSLFTRPFSLTLKLFVLTLSIVIIPLLIYLFITLFKSSETLCSTHTTKLQHQTALTGLLINQSFAAKASTLKTLIHTLPYFEDRHAVKTYLHNIAEDAYDLSGFMVFDDVGVMWVDSHHENHTNHHINDLQPTLQSFFKTCRDRPQNRVRFSDAMEYQGEPHLFLCTRFYTQEHEELFLLGALNLQGIAFLLSDFHDDLEGKNHVVLLDHQNRVVYSALEDYEFLSPYTPLNNPQAQEGFIEDHGVRLFSTIEPLFDFDEEGEGGSGLSLLAAVPMHIIDEHVNETLRLNLFTGLLIIIITLFVTLFLSRSLVRPLRQITHTAWEIKEGDYSVRVPEFRTTREFSLLGHAINDMVERIQSHTQELTAQQNFTRYILDQSPIFMMTSRDEGRRRYVNKSFLTYLGYESSDGFNLEICELHQLFAQIGDRIIKDEDNAIIIDLLSDTSQEHIIYFKQRHRKTHATPFLGTATRFEKSDRWLFTFADITHLERRTSELSERIESAEAIKHQQQQMLELQSRQAQMGEMIGSIAHQWKQPLNAMGLMVQGVLDAADHDELDAESLQMFAERHFEMIRYMSDTISAFRDFFRPTLTNSVFIPHQITDKALTMMGDQYKKQQITITLDERDKQSVQGIINEFQQVLFNLLNNARDAFNEHHKNNRHITITFENRDEHAYIYVEDNAGGIPESILTTLFDPYVTTKDDEHGTGIGLYMSKTIIEEKMKGRLEVCNTERGARFSIILPLFRG